MTVITTRRYGHGWSLLGVAQTAKDAGRPPESVLSLYAPRGRLRRARAQARRRGDNYVTVKVSDLEVATGLAAWLALNPQVLRTPNHEHEALALRYLGLDERLVFDLRHPDGSVEVATEPDGY